MHGRVLSLAALVTFGLAPLGLALTPLAAGRFVIPAVGLFAAAVNVATFYAVPVVPGVPHFAPPPAGGGGGSVPGSVVPGDLS